MSNAKSSWSRWSMISLTLVALAAFAIPALGQEADKTSAPASGYVDDWSAHHVRFSNPGTEQEATRAGHYEQWLKITNDPRYQMQVTKRSMGTLPATPDPNLVTETFGAVGGMAARPGFPRRPQPFLGNGIKKDWSMNQGVTNPSLTITFNAPTIGNVTGGASTITVDGQTFTASAPTSSAQTGSFTAEPATSGTVIIKNGATNTLTLTIGAPSTTTITIHSTPSTGNTVGGGSYTYQFESTAASCTSGDRCVQIGGTTALSAANLAAAIAGTTCFNSGGCPGAGASDANFVESYTSGSSLVTITNATSGSLTLTTNGDTHIYLNGAIQASYTFAAPAATNGNGCASGSSTTGTFINPDSTTALATALAAAITSCNTAHTAVGVSATSIGGTVTVTSDTPGTTGGSNISLGPSETITNFSWTSASLTGGTNGGGDTASLFNYWGGNAYDTANQLATDLYSAFNANSTLTSAFTISNTSNTITLTANASGSYTASANGNPGTLVTFSNGGFSSGTGAVHANTFPAKFSFATNNAPTCGDYVVYPTGGTGATLIAYSNIYPGFCATGNVPNVAWAYNTGNGDAVTSVLSPTLSSDGTQVAYIQTNSSNQAELVILRPAAGANNGTVGAPAAATYYAPGSYLGCTAPCYTTIDLDNSGHNDTNSSPYYVYGLDTLYVGDDGGQLHEFTPVFNGTPAEVTTSGWPFTVSSGNILTSPVYDGASGNVFVADSGGYLYSYKASTLFHEMTSSKLTYLSGTTGIVDGPMVDSTAEKVYVAVGDDANTTTSSGYTCQSATGCSGVFQFSATNSSGTGSGNCAATSASAWSGSNCGEEAIFGVGEYPNMYDGAFDNTYYSGTGTSGYLWECSPSYAAGNTIYSPRLAAVAIQSGGDIVTTGVVGYGAVTTAISNFSTTSSQSTYCSPVTEFYNTGQTGTPVTTTSGSLATAATTVTVSSVSGIAVGNYIQMGTEDMLVTAVNAGTKTLTLVRGAVGTTHNPGTFVSGTSVYIPAIDYLYLSVTQDGTVTPGALTCTGACLYSIAVGQGSTAYHTTSMTPTNGLASAGGTTGIVVDNSGTAAGESQIYYTNLSAQSCSGTAATGGGTGSCAVQTSQSAP